MRHSLSRVNEYRALSSPSLIALSSNDPLLTAFQLSWELRNLAFSEQECKSEYLDLRRQCQKFAVDLLDQSRSSRELAIILNHDPNAPPYEDGDHMQLGLLELAINYKQKKVYISLNFKSTSLSQFVLFALVCSASQHPTIVGRSLVRRRSWLSSQKAVGKTLDHHKGCPILSALLSGLHDRSVQQVERHPQKAFHEISRPRIFVFVFPVNSDFGLATSRISFGHDVWQ